MGPTDVCIVGELRAFRAVAEEEPSLCSCIVSGIHYSRAARSSAAGSGLERDEIE